MSSATTTDPEAVRRAVERTYTRASGPTQATRLAGYTSAQLDAVPDGVATSFFGCGNPLALADVKPGQTVLDLGSGAGLDLILAGQAVGPHGHVIGIDMTPAMIERARANVARAGLANVEIREGLIESLPVEAGSVDWVISNCVISLSPEKPRVFGEIARVLRPGGTMVISDIVVDDRLAWWLRRLVRITPSIAMAQTEASYFAAMRDAGLVDAAVLDRLVYEPADLIGLFADEVTQETAGACPVSAIGARVRRSTTVRRVLELVARGVAGHVWSSKFRAVRA